MSEFSIVRRKFTVDEFDDYCSNVIVGNWAEFVALHNTAIPSIIQRKDASGRVGVLTPAHIDGLHSYYQFQAPVSKTKKGWKGGPHLFVDRDGIWVFNPLDRVGRHSPGFNSKAWGVEMLGNYTSVPVRDQPNLDSFDSGVGLEIRHNAMRAVAALLKRLGVTQVSSASLKLHRDDTETNHACPGERVIRAEVYTEVQALLDGPPVVTPSQSTKIVIYRYQAGPDPVAAVQGVIRAGKTYADAAKIAKATGLTTTKTGEIEVKPFVLSRYQVSYDAKTGKVYLAEKAP